MTAITQAFKRAFIRPLLTIPTTDMEKRLEEYINDLALGVKAADEELASLEAARVEAEEKRSWWLAELSEAKRLRQLWQEAKKP